jgi:hypothetical protein
MRLANVTKQEESSMRNHLALYLGLAMALPLCAQTPPASAPQQQPAPQQGPAVDPYAPPLLTNVNEVAGDSRLVRAAKQTVAARRRMTGKTWKIDDSMVGHQVAVAPGPKSGNVSGPANRGGAYADSRSASTFSSAAPGASRSDLQAKKASLKNEQSRMSEETDQPYSGDVDQEKAEQRLTQVPAQINQVDKQLERKPPQE